MAFDSQSTVRGRELGDAVRRGMERADLSGKRIADLLGWSETKVSRILTGHVPPSETELSALLALCGIIGGQRDYLLSLCREQALLNWNTGKNSIGVHQQNALRITEFHNSLIPELLQVDGYAWSITARTVDLSYEDVDSWILSRQEAQNIFERISPKPPARVFFVHEQVLHLPIGGAEVMLEQLHHLLCMGARRHVDIRIIPIAAGAHPGVGGNFCFLEFSDFRPIAYIEDAFEGRFVEAEKQVVKYQRLIAALTATAIDQAASVELIKRIAATYNESSQR